MLNSARAFGLTFLFPERDTVVGATLRDHGEFARPEVDFLLALASEQTGTYLDVGANVGAIALPFAAARPRWRVRAVEAHGRLAGVLAANAYANHLYNVEVIHAAAGARREVVDFPTHPLNASGNFGDSGFHQRSSVSEPIALLPLDEIAPEDVRVIKVDVQGFEAEVLRGSPRLLAARQAVWFLEASPNRERFADMVSILLEAGYGLHWFWSPFVTPQAMRNPKQDATGDANVVALPPGHESPWPLPRLTSPEETRPGSGGAYRYLARYGFS